MPFLLATSYVTITINLQHVCECKNIGDIHPSEAHLQLKMLAMGNIMLVISPAQHENAMIMLNLYLNEQWGHRISFVCFKELLCES